MGELSSLGRILVFLGFVLLLFGALFLGMGKLFNVGRLPGDILIKKGNFTFFFPIVTSIILSIILTIVLNLLARR